jgi:hypothetical protein
VAIASEEPNFNVLPNISSFKFKLKTETVNYFSFSYFVVLAELHLILTVVSCKTLVL